MPAGEHSAAGGVVFAIFFIVVPALKDSVVNFVSLLPSRLTHLEHWWNNLAGFLEAHSIQLPEFSLNSAELQNNITSFLSKYGEDFLNTTIGITSSIFSLVVNLVLALAFSLYLLAQKETLTGQAKKVVRALFSEKWAHWITDVARMTNRTFSNFVTGQLDRGGYSGHPVLPGYADLPPALCRGDLGPGGLHRPHPHLRRLHRGGHRGFPDSSGQSHKSPVVYPLLPSFSSSWRATSSTPGWWASPWGCPGSGSWPR
ncbi:MAG: AI-2E family transporter [Evtepia gabavorous]